MAFERRQPSVDLRAFLDPLKPGEYFDCGPARLYGIDEALEAEAQRRGRAVGEDQFQLVATDGGLIFCRASIMFAIAARWKDLTIGRPEGGTRSSEATLAISWPTHGDLQFTVSRRLGSNVFRRWLQLQAQATRRSQVEQDVHHEPLRTTDEPVMNGELRTSGDWQTNGTPDAAAPSAAANPDEVDLREADGRGTMADPDDGKDDSRLTGPTLRLDDSDREAIQYATRQEQRRRKQGTGDVRSDPSSTRPHPAPDPLATMDAAVLDEWVDDRVPAEPRPASSPDLVESLSLDRDVAAVPNIANHTDNPSIRFEARPAARNSGSWTEPGRDATATQFMRRTADGTDIFPGDGAGRPPNAFGRSADQGVDTGVGGAERSRSGPLAVPVPEINGARLHAAESGDSAPGPRLDIRSTLLAGRQESEWVEMLRERQVLILGVITAVALSLIAVIGFLSGERSGANETVVGGTVDVPATADVGADTGAVPADDEEAAAPAPGSSTTVVESSGAAADDPPVDSTVPTLRVSSTSVQICHSNYGGCVPVAADVDCEGDGDGPAFQSTPVAVFGDDVYDLDTDDDRQACESGQPRAEQAAADG